MLSHLKNMTCLEEIAAKFYMFETQTAAVMLRLMWRLTTMQHPSFYDVTPLYPSFPIAYTAQFALKIGSVSDSEDYLHITSEHKTKPVVLK